MEILFKIIMLVWTVVTVIFVGLVLRLSRYEKVLKAALEIVREDIKKDIRNLDSFKFNLSTTHLEKHYAKIRKAEKLELLKIVRESLEK